jgi:hypothetical protein
MLAGCGIPYSSTTDTQIKLFSIKSQLVKISNIKMGKIRE